MVILNGEQCRRIPDSKHLNSSFAISSFSGSRRQDFGITACVNVMFHPMGWGWASHHTCAKWRGIFEANTSCHQGQNKGFFVLPMKRKQVGQQWAKRWAKTFWRRPGPSPYMQTILGFYLGQQ
jgi:hypothetical protein